MEPTPDDAPRRISAPIAVQIVALLIAGLAVGQIVTLLIVMLAPPPRPPIYRLSEVAAVLQGQTIKPRDGHALIRTEQAQPPPPPRDHQPGVAEADRMTLVGLLGVSEDRVRLLFDHPRPHLWGSPFFTDGDRRPRPPPPHWAGPPPRDSGGVIFGDFKAAEQLPTGDWAVVTAAPESFPNPWQARVMVWCLVCLAVLGPAGYLFARRLVAPIGAFAQAADRLGRDPSAPLLALSGPAEIGVAARAFNGMQARLKLYIEDRTSMIAAISHDLRTPLTRVRFKLEAAPADLQRTIGSDLDQMEAMISAVLAFVHEASHTRDRAIVDLLSVLECVVDDARDAGADVELTTGGALAVDGDALALQRLFTNLVDNAVKYGRRARVTLKSERDAAVVEIADDGPGLPASELERVFEPFYRAEPSRNPQTGGIGLGLSVARSIARAHGGDVLLRRGLAGLTAVVRLPLADLKQSAA
jgi:signal transduction histidine kinase